MSKFETEPSGLQRGSTLERQAWMAKVRRTQRDIVDKKNVNALTILAELLQYGRDREIRTGRKKNGL